MASKQAHSKAFEEQCNECGTQQPHEVDIELLTESDKEENTAFSREPYRVATCKTCGTSSRTRMNDA